MYVFVSDWNRTEKNRFKNLKPLENLGTETKPQAILNIFKKPKQEPEALF